MLNDIAIKNYLVDADDDELLYDIAHMVVDLSPDSRTINLKGETPEGKKGIVETMRPYLENYLYSVHSGNMKKRRRCRDEAKKGLAIFFKKHPRFGRRIVPLRRPSSERWAALSFRRRRRGAAGRRAVLDL